MPRRAPMLFALIACATALVAGPARGQTVPEARVDSVFDDVDTPTTPGCAVSVMRDGAPVYEQGYGMANLEYGIPITPSSVFHVASVSKEFTAMAVELLVNDGKVSWDDDIRKYVPEVPHFGAPITLRHLVHHVSGIRDQWELLGLAGWRWEADVVTEGDVLDITSRQTALNFPPGDRYLYSNTGFTLLAVVVERVSGQSLREFTTERIFRPLGMTSTVFRDDHEMLVRNRAWAYAPDPHGLDGYKSSVPDFDVVGATSLFTTVHDMAAWNGNFLTAKVGGPAALKRMQTRYVLNDGDTISYMEGLVAGRYRGLRTVSHSGADAGYRSAFLMFPDQRFGTAVLCNFPTSNPMGRANHVAEAYLDDLMTPASDPVAAVNAEPTVAIPRAAAAAVAGVYRGDLPYQVEQVRLVGDTLRIHFGTGAPLRPLGNGRFQVGRGAAVVTIHAATAGNPATMDIPGGETLRREDAWHPTPSELAAFAGAYVSDELGTEYRFAVEGDDLVFHHRKLPTAALHPALRDGFLIDPYGDILAFERDASGKVTGFTISNGRVWNVRFRREES